MNRRRALTGRRLAALLAPLLAAGACARQTRPGGQPTPVRPAGADAVRPATPATDTAGRPRAPGDTLPRPATPRDTLPLTAAKQADSAARPAVRRAEPQAERCALELENTPFTRAQSVLDSTARARNTFLGGGFLGRCRNQDMTLASDSAEYYESRGVYYLFGNVHYREKRATVDAQRLTYFVREERLLAEQDVRAVMPSGSTLTGPQVEYLRAVRGVRPRTQLSATGRPTLTLLEKDSTTGRTGRPAPSTLLADRITSDNDSVYYAAGTVELTRPDLVARGDSAVADNARGTARLLRGPSIQGTGRRAFKLWGVVIDLYRRNGEVERIVATDSAHVTSTDLELTSDMIDIRSRANEIEEAFAWGKSGARAKSADRLVTADSLRIRMPGQRLREMVAVRNAYAETVPDTARVRTADRDWMRGDTIYSRFDTLSAPDTSSRPRLARLEARGSARAYYHVPASRGRAASPSINYVKGRIIDVRFDSAQVQTVTVTDKATGILLEPAADSVTAGRLQPRRPAPAPRRP